MGVVRPLETFIKADSTSSDGPSCDRSKRGDVGASPNFVLVECQRMSTDDLLATAATTASDAPLADAAAAGSAPTRAHPFFVGDDNGPHNNIRGYYEPCCCGLRPGTGPDVPPHWFDGSDGWVTEHFVDVAPLSLAQRNPGHHRCKYCDFEVKGDSLCECTKEGPCAACCWCPLSSAPRAMARHLNQKHMRNGGPRREWATGLYDIDGFFEACFCGPCQASRQMMAQRGWANRHNCCWCLCFTCGLDCNQDQQLRDRFKATRTLGGLVLGAWLNRRAARDLQHIEERTCTTLCIACCCPVCSLAQTYREFTAAGVWPGGILVGSEPPVIRMDQPPPYLEASEPAPKSTASLQAITLGSSEDYTEIV